jgi:hypothetical protein
MASVISLDWQICPDGAEIHDDTRFAGKALIEFPEGVWRPYLGPTFRFRTSKTNWTRHKIENLEAPIILDFVNCKTDADLAAFIGKYGYLTRRKPKGPATVRNVREAQSELKNFLKAAVDSDKSKSLKWINNAIIGNDAVPLAPRLEFAGHGDGLVFTLRPVNLHGLMIMEAVLIAAADSLLHSCLNCGTLFISGTGTGRRSRAQYCSDKCRVAANRTKKKKS